jgi:hypothetical protein
MGKATTNVCNYVEGIYLQPVDENWRQETACMKNGIVKLQ